MQVSFTLKKRKGRYYLYFKAGREGTHYIMPQDSPTKANVQGIKRSLDYMQKRIHHDKLLINQLISYLPDNMREEYARKVGSLQDDQPTDL